MTFEQSVLRLLNSHRVRRINATTGMITTLAGTGTAGFSGDGDLAIGAGLNLPEAAVADRFGNISIADAFNNRIRRMHR